MGTRQRCAEQAERRPFLPWLLPRSFTKGTLIHPENPLSRGATHLLSTRCPPRIWFRVRPSPRPSRAKHRCVSRSHRNPEWSSSGVPDSIGLRIPDVRGGAHFLQSKQSAASHHPSHCLVFSHFPVREVAGVYRHTCTQRLAFAITLDRALTLFPLSIIAN